ncbi:MAG: arylsulfatase [Hydrogenophaga sp.]|uniref:aspartate/glutamate racemase family protein n=1 Tax=Hydrogenophaga sp. TaxID=1904254 RepID=UPI001D2AA0F2|nr:aspartate/glutamate racemase family protein [Hydrogenophaga sp.]MBX3610307.1 arylsulfatase [Hydrogenophaga sp.]
MSAPRIALIHALTHSVAPINEAMERDWPQAIRMNLLDDSLSADLARSGQGLDEAMHARFEVLTAYAESTGVQGILFTCSAFGPCIEAAAARRLHMPVLKPNEAMIDEAVSQANGRPIGLLATFGPTLQSMPPEFPEGCVVVPGLAEGALAALNEGDPQRHDALAVQAAMRLREQGCALIALAQFSLARAAEAVALATGLPVLTTPGSAIRALRRRLAV